MTSLFDRMAVLYGIDDDERNDMKTTKHVPTGNHDYDHCRERIVAALARARVQRFAADDTDRVAALRMLGFTVDQAEYLAGLPSGEYDKLVPTADELAIAQQADAGATAGELVETRAKNAGISLPPDFVKDAAAA